MKKLVKTQTNNKTMAAYCRVRDINYEQIVEVCINSLRNVTVFAQLELNFGSWADLLVSVGTLKYNSVGDSV